jgi:hypothetical protein
MGLAKLLISWDIALLTAPFVLTAWLLLFAIYTFSQLHATKLIGPIAVHPGAAIPDRSARGRWRGGGRRVDGGQPRQRLFRGVAEVFLKDNLWTGVVFAIAILVSERRPALRRPRFVQRPRYKLRTWCEVRKPHIKEVAPRASTSSKRERRCGRGRRRYRARSGVARIFSSGLAQSQTDCG